MWREKLNIAAALVPLDETGNESFPLELQRLYTEWVQRNEGVPANECEELPEHLEELSRERLLAFATPIPDASYSETDNSTVEPKEDDEVRLNPNLSFACVTTGNVSRSIARAMAMSFSFSDGDSSDEEMGEAEESVNSSSDSDSGLRV